MGEGARKRINRRKRGRRPKGKGKDRGRKNLR